MRYAIVINLDYESNGYDQCQTLWLKVRQGMIDAGFRLEGRIFTIEMLPRAACDRAREVIDSVNHELPETADIYTYLKEFYGYDHSHSVNLLLPPSDNFEILEG